MRYIFYNIWLGLARLHPIVSKVFVPMNKVIMKVGKKTKKDYQAWKDNYNKANLEFPGGINDWFAFAVLLALIYAPILILLFYIDSEVGFFNSKIKLYALLIGIAVFCYYWIYFKNINWLKSRINKESKKFYI